jgi:hypothetical protein
LGIFGVVISPMSAGLTTTHVSARGRSHSLVPGRAGDDEKLDTRAYEDLVQRLSVLHPAHSVDSIECLVTSALAETAGARVHRYRLVLAERKVREKLRTPTRT